MLYPQYFIDDLKPRADLGGNGATIAELKQ